MANPLGSSRSRSLALLAPALPRVRPTAASTRVVPNVRANASSTLQFAFEAIQFSLRWFSSISHAFANHFPALMESNQAVSNWITPRREPASASNPGSLPLLRAESPLQPSPRRRSLIRSTSIWIGDPWIANPGPQSSSINLRSA